MIKYKLICKNCDLSFDSWFASSKEFEKLKKKNFLNCHRCDSKKIEKTLMAPKSILKSDTERTQDKIDKFKEINKKIKQYQTFIKKNFKYVGDNFAFEARSIHYNNKKKQKGIYGTASNEEINELKAEGIDTETIPWVKDKNN
jgi:hypothetical protein|tara:strand:+ start:254 stop:682 length:429 start_codon:yes stop_codon:yes gene_type:complete